MKQNSRFSFFADPARATESFQKIAGSDEIDQHKLEEALPLLLEELKNSPDPDMAVANLDRFSEVIISRMAFFSSLKQNPVVTQMLLTLFGHSQFLADAMVRNPEYFDWFFDPSILHSRKTREEMEEELKNIVSLFTTRESRLNAMRRFKRREMLRIGLRDLMKAADLLACIRELSYLADVCLEMACELCAEELRGKYGIPIEEGDGQKEATFSIIAMGKLGGEELNYSSDIDVIFVYSDEGQTNGEIPLTNHEYFTKLAQNLIQVISGMTKEGYLFRVDARLRPEGLTGPLVRSLESYENYYASFGETWERLALIKARHAAGDKELGQDFTKMIDPFIYQKHTGFGAIEDLHKMKNRIDQQIAKKGTTFRNVKLGYGGIREIEFSVQLLQLLFGGEKPSLKGLGTLPSLKALTELNFITVEEESFLAQSYTFLRNVEHKLQIMHEQQLHTLPLDKEELNRFALRMGFAPKNKKEPRTTFLDHYKKITERVHQLYTHFFKLPEEKEPSEEVKSIEWIFEEKVDKKEVEKTLRPLGFIDAAKAHENLLILSKGPTYMHVPIRTQKLFLELAPFVLDTASKSPDPDKALDNLERFVRASGSRGTFYEVLLQNPKILELLFTLFGSSQFLSDTLMAKPDLFNLITTPGELGTKKDRSTLRQDIEERLKESTEIEEQMNLVRRTISEELLRISLRDLLGFIPLQEFFEEYSQLADAVTETAMTCVLAKIAKEPSTQPIPGLAIIGVGKFGGAELSYSSDLDLLFVAEKNNTDLAHIAAAKIIDFLSRNTEAGIAFKSDARLRPSGDQGPLAPTIESYSEYYQKHCATWEKQSLTKARFICGDEKLGQEFMALRDEIIYTSSVTEKETKEIVHMRERIEKERNKAKKGEKEIKLGAGGIMDIEFAVQYGQLKWGCENEAIRSPQTLQALEALFTHHYFTQEAHEVLEQGYRFLRLLENKLRIVRNLSLDKLPKDPAELDHCARRMGYHDQPGKTASQQLLDDLTTHTKAIRETYLQQLA